MNLTTTSTRSKPERPTLRVDKLLSLLGGSVRFELVRQLADRPQSVSSLAEHLDQSIGLVSHNLRLLRQHEIVEVTPNARQRIYSLSPKISCECNDQRAKLGFTLENGERVQLEIRLAKPVDSVQSAPSIQVPGPSKDRFTNHGP